MPVRTIRLPPLFALDGKISRNRVRQLARPGWSGEAEVQAQDDQSLLIRLPGEDRDVVATKRARTAADGDVITLSSFEALDREVQWSKRARWIRPEAIDPARMAPEDLARLRDDAIRSWEDAFSFRAEDRARGVPGLRSPQIGALHAVLAHWIVTKDPATVVMPTGTGKTETMLALLVGQRLERLLVVVPTVALRDQIAAKFLTLGVLKKHGVISAAARFPVVGTMEKRPRDLVEVNALFACCNVVVTNMHVIAGCDGALQERMAEWCSHVLVDEAHHLPAKTWDAFKRRVMSRVIVQFTATPFRLDGRNVDGRIVFSYPLRKAQEEDYFRPIDFKPVNVFSQEDADREIACLAVAQLEADRGAGFAHLVMARVDTIERARAVHAIYEALAAEHAPLLLHSDLPGPERARGLASLKAGVSRIVVCVDMLGEGFDLPELKIAALHDMHKSLAITLQFTGRFTRTAPHIGSATMIANIADVKVEEGLRALYAEDADWNLLLRRLSEGATERQRKRSALIESFTDAPPELPLRNIEPKMSAVVYRTTCERWRPEDIDIETKWVALHAEPAVSREFETAIFMTRETEPVPWGDVREVRNVSWHLYMLHWNRELGLLFINSSNNDSMHEDLARSVAGEVTLIKGEDIFRSLHGINRLILMNLGLSHSLSRAVRHMRLVGPDIAEAITAGQLETKVKSDTFGKGYAEGGKVTVGCSKKGRVWSYRIARDPSEWLDWCASVGRKLTDVTIDPRDIFLRNVLLPTKVTDRPALVPLAIEWSEDFYRRPEDTVTVDVGGEVVPFFEAGLELMENSSEGPITFRVFTETRSATYRIRFAGEDTVVYEPIEGIDVVIKAGKKIRTLGAWFDEEPPVIRFEDNTFLVYNEMFSVRPGANRVPYERDRIEAWDWPAEVDISVESQKVPKRVNSIQHHVIAQLVGPGAEPNYDFVLDDDDHHEAADIVALKVVGDRLLIHLYHCKFSGSPEPGARLDDLYAVCGQAQKSVAWKADVERLIRHLRLRSDARRRRFGVSRFEKGDETGLNRLMQQARFLIPDMRVFIVQPGLARGQASQGQLDLLAATEAYLQETYAVPLTVIASP